MTESQRNRIHQAMVEVVAERAAAAMEALLEHLSEHPEEARFAIVEVLAAGPKSLARRDAPLRQFAGFLESGRPEASVELPGITSLAVAGGVNELLYSEILHGAATRLPSRLPDLVFWITLPFLGAEGAAGQRDRAKRSARARITPASRRSFSRIDGFTNRGRVVV